MIGILNRKCNKFKKVRYVGDRDLFLIGSSTQLLS